MCPGSLGPWPSRSAKAAFLALAAPMVRRIPRSVAFDGLGVGRREAKLRSLISLVRRWIRGTMLEFAWPWLFVMLPLPLALWWLLPGGGYTYFDPKAGKEDSGVFPNCESRSFLSASATLPRSNSSPTLASLRRSPMAIKRLSCGGNLLIELSQPSAGAA
jgi:hypothetical protein